jgi:hypothetical protein
MHVQTTTPRIVRCLVTDVSKEETVSIFCVDEVSTKILHYVRITIFEQGPCQATLRLYHPEAVLLEFRM